MSRDVEVLRDLKVWYETAHADAVARHPERSHAFSAAIAALETNAKLREALEHHGTATLWSFAGGRYVFEPCRADLRGEPGYKIARLALGWKYPLPEPCCNPKCDGIDEEDGTPHRCFKDGYWL